MPGDRPMDWYKFWCNAHSHPKIWTLSDAAFRVLTRVWALARVSSEPGVVFLRRGKGVPFDVIAQSAGIAPDIMADGVTEIRDELIGNGLIAVDAHGVITVNDFDDHNGVPDSKTPEYTREYMREYRRKNRKNSNSKNCKKTEEEEEEEEEKTISRDAKSARGFGAEYSPLPGAEHSPRGSKNPRHQETIDLFTRLWSECRNGGKYRVVGARDGAAVKTLLKYPEATPEEVERRMRLAFSDPWFRQHGHVALFVSRWSNYDGLNAQQYRGKTEADFRPDQLFNLEKLVPNAQ